MPEKIRPKGEETTKKKEKLLEDAGFVIYPFMTDELGLRGNALLVYALIYSFAKAGRRFYGTQEYISQKIGCSESTARKLLGQLVSTKMITKIYKNKYNTTVYTINDGEEDEEKCDFGGCETTAEFYGDDRSFSAVEALVFGGNNKEIIKNTSSTSSTKREGAQEKDSGPVFLKYGVEGLVTMTEAQHEALCNSLGDEIAQIYVGRLETYLISNPGICLKSHYRTILKWAEEDARV